MANSPFWTHFRRGSEQGVAQMDAMIRGFSRYPYMPYGRISGGLEVARILSRRCQPTLSKPGPKWGLDPRIPWPLLTVKGFPWSKSKGFGQNT